MVLMVNNPSLDDVTQSFVNRETTNLNLLKGIGATFKRNIKIIMQYKSIRKLYKMRLKLALDAYNIS